MLTASHEEGPLGPLVKELKEIAPKAYAARVRMIHLPTVGHDAYMLRDLPHCAHVRIMFFDQQLCGILLKYVAQHSQVRRHGVANSWASEEFRAAVHKALSGGPTGSRPNLIMAGWGSFP